VSAKSEVSRCQATCFENGRVGFSPPACVVAVAKAHLTADGGIYVRPAGEGLGRQANAIVIERSYIELSVWL
jgi:hypothetical protein